VDGVVGYQIAFARTPLPRSDSRRLDRAYSPDERRLVLTLTEKGLNRLQDWLNAAWDRLTDGSSDGYYSDTLSMQALIVMSGNWWSPRN